MRFTALLAVLPIVASAQASTPEPAAPPLAPAATAPQVVRPPEAAAWSIGAGVWSSSPVGLGTTFVWMGSGIYVSIPQMPGVSASLERRLSERYWAVLGVSGGVARQRQDVPPTSTGVTRNDATTLAATGGLRYLLTPAGAPVDVSATALADVGALRWEMDALTSSTPARVEVTGWLVGANAGIAVDRELGRGLAIRVATPLFGVTYASTRTRSAGQPTLDGSDFSARAQLSPRLELRLVF